MIIAIVGSIGSGKTLLLTWILKQHADEGRKVLTNYRVKFPHELVTQQIIDEYAKSGSPLKDCVLGIDEAHILLDARMHAHQRNRVLTYFILQTRKRGVSLYYTSQNFFNCELRLREQTDYILQCTPVYEKDGGKKQLKAVRVLVTQYYGHDRYRDVRRFVLKHPERVFELYDTYEIVDFSQDSRH